MAARIIDGIVMGCGKGIKGLVRGTEEAGDEKNFTSAAAFLRIFKWVLPTLFTLVGGD